MGENYENYEGVSCSNYSWQFGLGASSLNDLVAVESADISPVMTRPFDYHLGRLDALASGHQIEMHLTFTGGAGRQLSQSVQVAPSRPAVGGFHTDVSFLSEPTSIIVCQCRLKFD